MNHTDFVALVARMRAAQQLYFRSRLPADLKAAKDLERAVDDILAPPAAATRGLFDDPPAGGPYAGGM